MSGVGVVAARVAVLGFSDPHNARILSLAAFSLFAVGVLVALGTRYWWRNASSEHPALGRLETMRPSRAVSAREENGDGEASPQDVNEAAVHGTAVNGSAVGAIDPGLRAELEATE